MPEVAILVAAYNAAATLPRTLDSLCGQTYRDIQVICIDDCSTDTTLSILQQRAAQDSRIKVLQTPVNSGQAVARNLALKHVAAPLVGMVDADDWLSPDALELAVNVFREHPQTDCCVLRLVNHDAATGHESDYGMPEALCRGKAVTGRQAFEWCLDGWRLHGLYITRTELHRRYPFDDTCRLYSDDNASRLHYLHSREVRACTGTYFYYRHPASMTDMSHFSLHHFDIMEANLSLKLTLKKEEIARSILRRYEVSRWMTFIACYRLYLSHEEELTEQQKAELAERFRTILHTFRPSQLPLRCRWKPGYQLTISFRLFDWQQRFYITFWEEGIKFFYRKIR